MVGDVVLVGIVFEPVDHPRFSLVDPNIFTATLVADCMTHSCKDQVHIGAPKSNLDACCQYGADVDLAERAAILQRQDEIQALLHTDCPPEQWFTDKVIVDKDFPSGEHVRTQKHGDGCIFLQHDKRGCAIHRASIAGQWDFRGTKPAVCRLFPVTFTSNSIEMSDDFIEYSCAYDPSAPTVYQVQRGQLADIFGQDLVEALDIVETQIVGKPKFRVIG